MKGVKAWLREQGSPFFLAVLLALTALFLLSFRIGSITHGLASALEVQTHNVLGNGWLTLAGNHALDFPYYAPAKLLGLLHPALFVYRLLSGAFALLAGIAFYYTVLRWHGYKIATLACLLLASNSLLLHLGRTVAPDILQPLVSTVLLALVIASRTLRADISVGLWCIALPFSLLVPGGVWLVLLCLALNGKRLAGHWRDTIAPFRTATALILLVLLAPLIWYFLNAAAPLAALKAWAGITLPGSPQAAVMAFLHHFARVPLDFFYHTNPTILGADRWLGNVPILGTAGSVVFLAGLFLYLRRFRDGRATTILSFGAVAWIVGALDPANVGFLLPIMYVIIGTGFAYLLREWYKVFPRNPVARTLGVTMLYAVAAAIVIYHTRAYFVAWPHTPDMRDVFRYSRL